MRGREHFPLQNLDLNSNTEKSEECSLYDLLDVALKSGRLIFLGISYTVDSSETDCSNFVVRNHRRYQFFLRLLHAFLLFFLIIPFITEHIYLSPCCLVNLIKKGLHVAVGCCMIVGYYCLEIKGRRVKGGMSEIFQQCALLQKNFKAMGLQFPTRSKIRGLAWAMSLGICLFCLARQILFASKASPWYGRYSRQFSRTASLGFWTPSNDTTPEPVYIVLGLLGLLSDTLIANYWYFVQFVHFSLAVTMWAIFDKLNSGMKSGLFKTKHLSEVVNLHFESNNLLKKINQLISPLTFSSILFDIICMCFWTNYIAIDREIKPIYIAAVCFFLKMMVELVLVADVNSKAHEITEWLEECCATSEKFPTIDPIKFQVFTTQVYSKETTGFRGLKFFVVTPHLVVAVAGIVITYTVAVHQFCKLN